ncbi:MAG: hypothetical protein E7505_05020 [Ruminococcus sp.]|nr:hypothetical protein [Ruminococcus sp.]
MSGIIYKNFLAYKLDLITLGAMDLISIITILLTTAAAHSLEEKLTNVCPMIYILMFFMVSIFDHQLFAADEKRTIGSFNISCPSGAKGHVEGKYYTLLIVNIATLVICFLTDTVICLVVDSTMYSMGSALMIIFCGNILYTAFANPFYLRFGIVFGNTVKFGSIGVLLVIGIIYFLFGDISFILESENLLETVMTLLSGDAAMIILSIFPAVSILLYWVSCKISVPLYKKGVEAYEQ